MPLGFIVMGGQAALDHETGLVWELIPSSEEANWYIANERCMTLSIDNRMGWRLPAVEELLSLIDTSQSPALPAGHPFTVFTSLDDLYWTKTSYSDPSPPTRAYAVEIGELPLITAQLKADGHFAWCVRGGAGYDGVSTNSTHLP